MGKTKKISDQINKVNIITDMVRDVITKYKNDRESYDKWEKENPEKHAWHYPTRRTTTAAEVKRLMMVLRTETTRLEKMI